MNSHVNDIVIAYLPTSWDLSIYTPLLSCQLEPVLHHNVHYSIDVEWIKLIVLLTSPLN